jgi:hypothetical protein
MVRRAKIKRRHDPADYGRSAYRVTLFLPQGRYPDGTFCAPTGLFHADPEIVFSVTFGPPWHVIGDDLPYSEADWLLPDAVRLLGSLMLTERFTDRRCGFYPLPHSAFIVDETTLDLTRPESALSVKSALLNTVNNRLWAKRQVDRIWRLCLGHPYFLFDPHELEIDQYQRHWVHIDTKNYVLMRALQALIKADMLAAHHEFMEEASIACLIALDASFELVRRHLKATGHSDPSARDAGDWLFKTFDEPLGVGIDGMKYFEEFYTQRVRTIHPASRFGDTPFAAVAYDDYIHLRQALPQILSFLVLGTHSPRFAEEVAERERYLRTPIPDHCAK